MYALYMDIILYDNMHHSLLGLFRITLGSAAFAAIFLP
jgi:hypothetical protein